MARAQTRHNETGQSIVELALAMPVLLLLVLGVVDLGMGFKTYIALTNAAREGVRWVSIHPADVTGAQARVANEAASVGLYPGSLEDGGFIADFESVPEKEAPYATGDKVIVSINYDYPLLFGAMPSLSPIRFNARATMVVLYEPPSPTP